MAYFPAEGILAYGQTVIWLSTLENEILLHLAVKGAGIKTLVDAIYFDNEVIEKPDDTIRGHITKLNNKLKEGKFPFSIYSIGGYFRLIKVNNDTRQVSQS